MYTPRLAPWKPLVNGTHAVQDSHPCNVRREGSPWIGVGTHHPHAAVGYTPVWYTYPVTGVQLDVESCATKRSIMNAPSAHCGLHAFGRTMTASPNGTLDDF
jgi:hypothetical protein